MSEFRTSEFEEAYDAHLEGGSEEIKGEILGRRIRLLKPAEAVCLEPGDTVQDAIDLMKEKRIGAILIKTGGNLEGIFTERDVLMKCVGLGKDFKQMKLTEVMTADPETLSVGDRIAFALNKMHLGGFRHIPVIDNDADCWRIVSVRDIASWIVELFPDQVLNLPPDTDVREPNRETGG